MHLTLNILNTLFLLLALISLGAAGGGEGALLVVICLATLTALNLDNRKSLYWLTIVLNGVVFVIGLVAAVALFFSAGGTVDEWVLAAFVLLFMLLLPVLNMRYIKQHCLGNLA